MIDSVGNFLIIRGHEEYPYVFKNPTISHIDMKDSSAFADTLEINIKLEAKIESKNGTIKINFKDGDHVIDVNKYIKVEENYGSLENMSFREYRERLLVLEL